MFDVPPWQYFPSRAVSYYSWQVLYQEQEPPTRNPILEKEQKENSAIFTL